MYASNRYRRVGMRRSDQDVLGRDASPSRGDGSSCVDQLDRQYAIIDDANRNLLGTISQYQATGMKGIVDAIGSGCRDAPLTQTGKTSGLIFLA